eukprot:2579427-Pyramimonas_sp.AAC.1
MRIERRHSALSPDCKGMRSCLAHVLWPPLDRGVLEGVLRHAYSTPERPGIRLLQVLHARLGLVLSLIHI